VFVKIQMIVLKAFPSLMDLAIGDVHISTATQDQHLSIGRVQHLIHLIEHVPMDPSVRNNARGIFQDYSTRHADADDTELNVSMTALAESIIKQMLPKGM
jgi:hypothetical protein